MSGYARFSASLVLTLLIWSPTALAALRNDTVNVEGALIRFLIVFTLTRIAMRGIDRLIRVYAEHNANVAARVAAVEIDDSTVGFQGALELGRRRTDVADGSKRELRNTNIDDNEIDAVSIR